MSAKLLDELEQVLNVVENDEDIRVLVITVAPRPDGRPCFCAGEDLHEIANQPEESNREQLEGMDDDVHFVNLSSASPRRVYVATAVAPFRSDDAGDSWEKINGGLTRPYTLHISAAPDDADLVLVTVSSNAGRSNPQFYRSTDGGQHWQLVGSIGCDDDMVVAIDWDIPKLSITCF